MTIRQIVTTIHGSHLYGTSTPSSDQDYKGIHLPAGRSIILQRPENVIDTSIEAKNDAGKNTGEAVDRQSYSLKKFCEMIAAGDTVATEILFAPDWAIINQDEIWPVMRKRLTGLLNSNIEGYASYCLKQASRYGVKGGRMAALKALMDALEAHLERNAKVKLEGIRPLLEAVCAKHDLVTITKMTKGESSTDMLECCERMVPMTATIETAHRIYNAIWINYGERSRLALANEGIDWKALSHAVRVARQARELVTTGKIVFPRPDAAELKAIKAGVVPYAEVATLLEGLVDEMRCAPSVLPAETSSDLMEDIIYDYYRRQV